MKNEFLILNKTSEKLELVKLSPLANERNILFLLLNEIFHISVYGFRMTIMD